MSRRLQLLYNKDTDILYLSIGEPRPAISEEIGDDILLRHDLETNEVVGLTILNLSTRFGSLGDAHPLPIEIEVHKP